MRMSGSGMSFLHEQACGNLEAGDWSLNTHGRIKTQRETPVAGFATEALDRRRKRILKRGARLKQLDSQRRHKLRIATKKLRYATEFFSPIYPIKQVRKFLKKLKKLQVVFGDLNDAVTVKAILTETHLLNGRDAGLQRAIGWMMGTSQARAEFGWKMAKDLWRDLDRARPFWRGAPWILELSDQTESDRGNLPGVRLQG